MKKQLLLGCMCLIAGQSQIFADGEGDVSLHMRDRCENNGDRYQHEEKPSSTPSVSRRATDLHMRVQIGGNYTWASVKPNGSRSFSGNMGGVQGIYEYRPQNFFYGGGKFAWKEGRLHNSTGKRSLFYVDVQERLGYTFGWCNGNLQLSLFSGAGYRHLGQKHDPDVGDSTKYFYNEIYVPAGFLVDYAFTDYFILGLNGTWMPQVYPTVRIVPLDGSRWIIRRKLANFSVELPMTFTWPKYKRWSVIINPSYERWQDGHTTAVNALGIPLGVPGNKYNFWGVDLNFAYSF